MVRVPAASRAGFGLGQRPAADPFAGRQLGDVAAALLVAAHLVNVIGAERGVRGDDDAHRAIHAREFFDDDGVLDVAQARAAQFFGEDRAQVAELAQLFDHLQREDLRLVPLHHVGRDLRFGEFADGFAKLDLFRRVLEIHRLRPLCHLDDLFFDRIPAQVRLLAVAVHGHAAGDGDAEADVERAVRLACRCGRNRGNSACARCGSLRRVADHFVAVFAVHFLRQIFDAAAPLEMVPSVPSTSSVTPSWLLPKPESQVEEDLLGMLHGDVHGVGNFAAVLPEVDAAGHGDGPGNLEVHHLVPEGELVAHVLVDVAAGIIPEEAPVDVAVGIELVRCGASPRKDFQMMFSGVISG